MPQRSAPNTLTNAICKKCNEVTTHQHGDCIACTRFALDLQAYADRIRSGAGMVELGYDLDELDEVNPFTQYGDGIKEP